MLNKNAIHYRNMRPIYGLVYFVNIALANKSTAISVHFNFSLILSYILSNSV